MSRRSIYYAETEGVRVSVRPMYLAEQSHPERQHFVFAYFVRIENTSHRKIQLLSRQWLIHDSADEDREVIGEGIVGEQPVFVAGHVHEYHSFCILKSRSGSMEGAYRFIRSDDSLFDVAIPHFLLEAPR
jgi:ApaG protein